MLGFGWRVSYYNDGIMTWGYEGGLFFRRVAYFSFFSFYIERFSGGYTAFISDSIIYGSF